MQSGHDFEEMSSGDRIILEDLCLLARVGVYPHEKLRRQSVSISMEIGLLSQVCFETDSVGDTIDYGAVANAVQRLAVSRHFNLVEYLAEHIARLVLDDFQALWVKVRVCKLHILPDVRRVGVAITRLNAKASVGGGICGPSVRAKMAGAESASNGDE
jgi:dihydroneopterin aldolase